jgi:hypothetical protein
MTVDANVNSTPLRRRLAGPYFIPPRTLSLGT